MRRGAAIAALAACVASTGDLAMLWVANAWRPMGGLPQPLAAVLWIGALLGVVSIPLYALGYQAAGRAISLSHPRAGRLVSVCGTLAALLGTLIHGLTAHYVAIDAAAGAPARDPLVAVASWGLLLPALWTMSALLVVVASGAFAVAVRRGDAGLPARLAWANPALATVVIALLGLPSLLLRAFLVPAAPNLAHVVFFAATARGMPTGLERERAGSGGA